MAAAFALAAAGALLTGCGDGSGHADTGCMPPVAAAVGGSARATPAPASLGVRGCRYMAGRAVITVSVDSNPQAAFRWDRAVEESDQVALWSHHRENAPVMLNGIGVGADWLPGDGLMLSTDGKRLVSVRVLHSRKAQQIARRVTLAVLRSIVTESGSTAGGSGT